MRSKSVVKNDLGTKPYGVITVQRSLVHPLAISSFQTRHKCREAHCDKNGKKIDIWKP
jgi:hypothetical protein